MKKILLTTGASILSIRAMSQDTPLAAQGFWSDPLLPFYLTAAAVCILLVLVIAVAIYTVRVLNLLTEEVARRQAVQPQIAIAPRPSPWKRFLQRANRAVPVEREKEIELDHSYDGIRELDNYLPPWWKWLFYSTIAFAAVYMFVFHVSGALPLSLEEYEGELARAERQIREYQASQPRALIDENTLAYVEDAALIENGQAVFNNNNCGGCHRADGGGNAIGPNLTDEYWIHGGDIKNIFRTIKNGVVEKGMPAWGKSMSAQDVRDVTFFVMSLRGTDPPDAKGPQGELIKHEMQTKTDSSKVQAGL